MAGVELATAYISLNVNTSNVKKQVESAFNGVSARSVGDRMGSDIATGIRGKLSNLGFVRRALEDSARGAGSGSARKFFQEFDTTAKRLGAVTGAVIGKTIGLGIRAGLGAVSIAGTIFAKLEIAAKRSAAKMGAMMAATIRGVLASTGVGLGIAGLAGAGGVLLSGLDRLKTIQRSEVQLSLKLSPAEVKKVKDDILEVVQGIPVNLDQAMQAVPRALNSGVVKQGDDLKQYIMDIANTTASTGGQSDFQRIDLIFGQVINKGKLMGEELMQLTEAGVDMRNALKEAFGWDDQTLNKNIEKGKVGINEMRQAVQATFGKDGGLAKRMNETFDGATGTMKATISRIGAGVIGAIFGDPNNPDADPMANAAKGINNITDGLKKIEKWIADNRAGIHNTFSNGAKAIGMAWKAVKVLWEWLGKAKDAVVAVGKGIGDAFGKAVDVVTKVKTTVSNTITSIRSAFTGMVDDVKKVWDSIFGENGWFAEQFKKIEALVNGVRDLLGFGPAVANAGGAGTYNPGPLAPGVAAGQQPLGGSTMGLSAVPKFGFDANGNPLVSLGDATGAAILPPGSEPRRVGSSANMLPDAVALKDRLTTMFPEITDVGGYRPQDNNAYGIFDEHASGKAFDIMVPKQFMDPKTGKATPEGIQWGNRVLAEALKQGASVLWQQQQFDPDGAITEMLDRGGDPTQNHFDHLHVLWDSYANYYAGGGSVRGAGSGTSDSIPAMLSNGEHVLTAADVAALGGQNSVYAFRAALQAGLIPGFDQGGAVDPDKLKELQQAAQDAAVAQAIQRQQLAELPSDAGRTQRRSAEINRDKSARDYQQAVENALAYQAGRAPIDMSEQNKLYELTDAVELAQLALEDAQNKGDVPQSQMMQLIYAADQAKRERNQAIDAINKPKESDKPASFLDNLIRTQGFTPSGGGGEAGTSSLAGFINMGNEVVGGFIDLGASLAQTAISAATSAAGGAAAAQAGPAGPLAGMALNAAASYGIQLGAAELKRISSYWFQVAGIGADSLIAQMFPFGGPPRWIGYDYTSMMPQLGIQQAALTTLEQMGSQAINDYFTPKNKSNVNVPGLPQSRIGSFNISTPGGGPLPGQVGGGVGPQPGPMQGNNRDVPMAQLFDPTSRPPDNPPPPGGFTQQYDWFKNQLFGSGMARGGAVGVYDSGGVLKPGDIAVNKSKIPEKVLTSKQWDAMSKLAVRGGDAPLVKIDAIYGMSPEDVAIQIEQRQRLAAMQYSGRPY